MLEHLDQVLFYAINGLEIGPLDKVFILFRTKTTWIPLYVFIAGYSVYKLGRARGILIILLSVLCIVVGDQLSSEMIKKNVQRARPCHFDSEVSHRVILRVPCGSGYSFTSSHATNHMALAVFWYLALMPHHKIWRWTLLLWGTIVGLCQVYVGVHYPTDIIGGFLLGTTIALMSYHIFRLVATRYNQDPG